MQISHNLLNNKILRKIERFRRLSDRYRMAQESNSRFISYKKPVGIKISDQKITITLMYTFENYQVINDSIIKKFKRIDLKSSFERLIESENILDYRGWNNLGLIFDNESKDWRANVSGIKVKNFPRNTKYISCSIHRIIPSTSFLSFDFFLDTNFSNQLYKNFYLDRDIVITSDLFLKKTSIQGTSSSTEFDKNLSNEIEYYKNWILNFLNLDDEIFLSINNIIQTNLEKLSDSRLNRDLIERNRSFLSAQSFYVYSYDSFNNGTDYYNLENIKNIKLFKFKESSDTDEIENRGDDFLESLFILIAIDTYKKDLEQVRKNNLKFKRKYNLLKLKDDMLKNNTLDFQINRLFQEIEFYSVKDFLSYGLKKLNFMSTSEINNFEYNQYFTEKVNFQSKLLIKNSESLKKLLEIKFNSLTTETNYKLQNRMKWLTIMTTIITIISLIIAIIGIDYQKSKINLESIRNDLNSLSIK
ncbi:hypothetical protein [Acinetobacter nosocomialis]|uniref:hypothetical protein n=1 Tax=Acinetobacter nosocomialis TaxID=106654 RepID=UPI0023D80B21|nr:hypothetical protein [Acinetobacter nosocomialis]MDF0628585.1 hypothetical protein [Acinetobacter nosocomialis]